MSKEHKEYIPVSGNDKYTDIQVCVYYDKGGYDYFRCHEVQRGFYILVCPVKRSNTSGCVLVEFEAFAGMKMLIKPVHRYSSKAFDEAVKDAEDVKNDLIYRVCFKQGITLCQEEIDD